MVFKHSHKRDAILNCIRSTGIHPSAEWVYAQLKPSIPELSLGTVYRNLTVFRRQGEIASIGVVQGLERFDGDTRPHAHFICTECGAVIDMPSVRVPDGLHAQAEAASGGDVTACRLNFMGRCADCRRATQKSGVSQ